MNVEGPSVPLPDDRAPEPIPVPGPEPRKSRRTWVIALVVFALLTCGCAVMAGAVYFVSRAASGLADGAASPEDATGPAETPVVTEQEARDAAARDYVGFTVVDVHSYQLPGDTADRVGVVLESKTVKGFRWMADSRGASDEFYGETIRFIIDDPRAGTFMKFWATAKPDTIVSDVAVQADRGLPNSAEVWFFGVKGPFDQDSADVEGVNYDESVSVWALDIPMP